MESSTLKLKADDQDFSSSKISFTADVDSITTNNEQRDGHLKSADFFDIAKNPTLSFVSTKLEKVSDEEYTLYWQSDNAWCDKTY